MGEADRGFIDGWAGKIRGIVTRVEVAVFTKSDSYNYRRDLEKATNDMAAQAASWLHGSKEALIRHLMRRLASEAELLETPNSRKPGAHKQPHTIKRATLLREAVEMLNAHLPAQSALDEVAAPLLPRSENRNDYHSDARQEKLL